MAALGASQRAQARAAHDVALATVQALTLRAPFAGVVQYARPATATSTDPLAALLGAAGAGSGAGGLAATAGSTGSPSTGVAGVDDVLAIGDQVSAGQVLATIEAMKMEANITAPRDATVARLLFTDTRQAEGGDLLLTLD